MLKFKRDEENGKTSKWKLEINSDIEIIEGNQLEVGELYRNAFWNISSDKIYFFTDRRFLLLDKTDLRILK